MNHEQISAFLRQHPRLRAVDTLMCDQSGVLRGTRLDLDGLKRLTDGGYVLESAIFAMDVCGRIAERSGLGAIEGYADRACRAVDGSLFAVPWLGEEIGQIQITMIEADGTPYFADPRNVLARCESRLGARGLRPVVALELEFYLLDPQRHPELGLRPPRSPRLGRRLAHSSINSMTDLSEYSELIQEIAQACALQDVPATTTIAEYGPGQFEINLRHVTGALAACDHAVRFKRIVKGVAARHGLVATFMSQPFHGSTGSGTHVHLSLLDEAGRNVFAAEDELGSVMLHRCAAGLLVTMADATAIFAPNANSYRRLRQGGFVPLCATWGANHRGAALRVPHSDPQNRRIEHRVAGADANPYLVCAAILAGLTHGLEHSLAPPPPLRGPAAEAPAGEPLPVVWQNALERLRRSPVLREHLGAPFIDVYAAVRELEFEEFAVRVSPLEHEWYLAAM